MAGRDTGGIGENGFRIDSKKEGGFAEIASDTNSPTTLEVFREEGELKFTLDAISEQGYIGLGVSLNPEQSYELAHQIIVQAKTLETENEQVNKEA
jgi:hypothetical protein